MTGTLQIMYAAAWPSWKLVAVLACWLAGTGFGAGLYLRMRRRPELLSASAGSWKGRQLFLNFYLLGGLALLPVLLFGLSTLDDPSVAWLCSALSDDPNRLAGFAPVVYIAGFLAFVVCYSLPYLEALRRGPRRVVAAAPRRFTLRSVVGTLTFQTLVQTGSGFLVWALALWLGSRLGVPRLLSSAVAAIVGMALTQSFWVWWLRRKSVGLLAPEHPAALAAGAALASHGGEGLARRIYLLPAERFPSPNAFVVGLSARDRVIAVTEPLLSTLSPEEVAAVLLHEQGHVREHHTLWLALCLSILATWQLIFITDGQGWLAAAGVPAGLVALAHQLLIYAGTFLWLAFPFALLSRWCERRADHLTLRLGWGQQMADALAALSRHTETPGEWPRWLRYLSTHPSYRERIDALRGDSQSKPIGTATAV